MNQINQNLQDNFTTFLETLKRKELKDYDQCELQEVIHDIIVRFKKTRDKKEKGILREIYTKATKWYNHIAQHKIYIEFIHEDWINKY